jgi:hypothetical protein
MELIVIQVERSKAVLKKIIDKVRKNACLKCGAKMHKRGLCVKCASVFEYQLRKLPTKSAKKRYEGSLLEDGLLLNPHEIRKFKSISDPFVAAADKAAY